MISLQQMHYIVVLSDEQQFQKASEKCFVTQPTLSMQIKKAEEMLEEEKKLSHEYAEEVTKWVDIVQNLTQQLNQSKSEYDKLERWNRQLINTLREHNVFVGNP
jgi:chromosome segregation ATPase